jgi:hypothetical protein
MATTPIIHVYREIIIGKYATVRHFELQETLNGFPQLSPFLNISNNRNFAFSKPIYWVKERKEEGWVKPYLTGLFETGVKNLYRGDANHKKHFLFFRFENENRLSVFYFKNQFSTDISGFLDRIIELHY